MATRFRYRQSVLDELVRHGIAPAPDTPAELVHDFVSDLYVYEIRKLRAAMRAGLIPKSDYANHVAALRRRYPVLSLPVHFWTEAED